MGTSGLAVNCVDVYMVLCCRLLLHSSVHPINIVGGVASGQNPMQDVPGSGQHSLQWICTQHHAHL